MDFLLDTLSSSSTFIEQRTKDEALINEHVEKIIKEYLEHLNSADSSWSEKNVFKEALVVNKGGKRLRALLEIAAARAMGCTQSTLTIASACEIFQSSALIHDDIIDNSEYRRGRLSSWRVLDVAGLEGHGLALLLGDLLLTLSVQVLFDTASMSHFSTCADIQKAFLKIQQFVEEGQILDANTNSQALNDPDNLMSQSLRLYRQKTASYTTTGPLHLGFLAAQVPDPDAYSWAKEIGDSLGIAFQIANDIADISTDASHSLSDDKCDDIRDGKHTLLLAHALKTSSPSQKELLKELYSQSQRTAKDIQAVLEIFHSCDVLSWAQEQIKIYRQKTYDALLQWKKSFNITEENFHYMEFIIQSFFATK